MYRFRSPLAFLKVEPMISLFAITGTVYNDRFFFTFFYYPLARREKMFHFVCYFKAYLKKQHEESERRQSLQKVETVS